MNLKNRMQLTEIKEYRILKKKILKAFQKIVTIFIINPIDFSFFLFYMSGF